MLCTTHRKDGPINNLTHLACGAKDIRTHVRVAAPLEGLYASKPQETGAQHGILSNKDTWRITLLSKWLVRVVIQAIYNNTSPT